MSTPLLSDGRPRLAMRLHQQQGRAIMSRATEVLYGGAAGGGKSHMMRAAAIKWCLEVPGLQVYFFRRLYPELVATHMEGPTGFPALLAPVTSNGWCRIIKGQIRFGNGSKIHLRHCQRESDVLSYQGVEIHVLIIDELTHWTATMYAYLRGRLRMTAIQVPPHLEGQFPRSLMGTNPGGIGHHWVKHSFVDAGPYRIREMEPIEGGMRRQFIPAKLSDNPTLLRADPHYVDKLAGLGDPLLVRALKDGDWKIVPGAMFGETWRDELHTCPPFAIPMGWPIWRGADDGYASPAACYWMTRDPDTKTIYVLAELYRCKMLPEEYAERVLRQDRELEIIDSQGRHVYNREELIGIMDSAAFVDIGNSHGGQKVPSRGAHMNNLGCRWKPCDKAPGSRIQRVQEFHRVMAPNPKDRNGRPGIVFFSTCRTAIETIPTLPRDKDNQEDVDTDAEDHAFDAVTYGLQRVHSAGKLRLVGV